MSDIRAVRLPTVDDVDRAARVIAGMLKPTPLSLAPAAGLPHLAAGFISSGLTLKLEGLQPTGSFKVRGALAALSDIDPDTRVVTASAGNHALGVAFAARVLGRSAVVVTSTKASPVKLAAIRRLGVDLVQVGDSFDEAEAYALELASHGARYVSPYNDPHVIAGQATIGTELAEQLPGPLTVVCPVGGGGLASGIGLWASTRPDVRLVGVEAEVSTAVSSAVAAGGQTWVSVGETIADGMAGNIEPGSVTIELISRYVDELVTVTDLQIRDAIRFLAAERGIVAEGAGAAAVAAVTAGQVEPSGQMVAVVSGRNIAPGLLADIYAASDEGNAANPPRKLGSANHDDRP